jgi:hypothetical protein
MGREERLDMNRVDLRRHCARMNYVGWRKLPLLKLERFVLRRRVAAAVKIQRFFRTKKQQPQNIISLDFETMEALNSEDESFGLREGNSLFLFKPLQLLTHFLASGNFSNPLTRTEIKMKELKRLCEICEARASFDLDEQTHVVTTDLLYFRTALREKREHDETASFLAQDCIDSFSELFSNPGLLAANSFIEKLRLLQGFDASRYGQVRSRFLWDLFPRCGSDTKDLAFAVCQLLLA